MIYSLINNLKRLLNINLYKTIDDQLMLNGKIAANLYNTIPINSITDVEFKVYSQRGEDGILEWLINHLPISTYSFIEFGVEDYLESNTRFLLKNRNWKGLIIDANDKNINLIKQDDIYWHYDIIARQAFITRENINQIFIDHGFTDNIGVLSIDIDGNDYWVWKAIDVISPDIVICEYNAVFGDKYAITIPYQQNFNRTKAHFSNLYFGASLKAIEDLAIDKGYFLIGTNSAGTNAFFVKNKYSQIINKIITTVSRLPSALRESKNREGRLTHIRGLKRLEEIRHLYVELIDKGELVKISDLIPLYSDYWKNLIEINNP